MAQWVKESLFKPSSQSLIPRTHALEEEQWLTKVVIWPLGVFKDSYIYIQRDMHTQTDPPPPKKVQQPKVLFFKSEKVVAVINLWNFRI